MENRQASGRPPISTEIVRRRIIRFAVGGGFVAAVLVGATILIPSFSRLADAQHEKLVHSAQLTAHSVSELLKWVRVVAELSANQFQARQFLIMFNSGQIDADTVNASTAALLTEVIAKHKNIQGLVRLDKNRRVASVIGAEVPEHDWPRDTFSSNESRIGSLHAIAGQVHFTVSAPVFDPQNGRIGTDIMMMDAAELLDVLRPATKSDDLSLFLAVPRADGIKYLSPAGFVTIEGLAGFAPEVNDGAVFVRFGDLDIGVAPVGINDWLVLETSDSKRHLVQVWADIATALLLALVATGVVGIAIYAAMAPLATGLVVHAETLEAEVTQRTRELNRSEERFRGFAEAVSDWFWETDSGHRFTYLSDAVVSAAGGHVSQQALGKARWELPGATPVSGEWSDHRAQMDAHESFIGFEYEIDGDDSLHRVFSVSGRPHFDGNGTFLGYRGVGRNITELRRAEQKRERAERLFLDSIASVPVAIALFDPDDHIIVWNRRYASEITKDVNLVAGMTFEEIVRIAIGRGRIAEAEGNEQAWMERRLQQHRDPKSVLEVCLDEAVLEIREYRTREGYTIFIAHDVTRLKQAEADLRAQKDLLQTILENIPHAVYWKDQDLIYRGANRRFLETWGRVASEEIIGKSVYDFLPNKKEADAVTEKDRAVLVTKEAKVDFEDSRTLEDGSVRTHLSSKVPLIGPDGNPTGVLGIFTDITEVKRAEEMERRAQRLESLGNLAAGLAHELNNLLLPIVALSDMTLRKLPQDAAERSRIEKIAEAAERAAAIVSQVTEFGSADEAKLAPLELRPVIEGSLDLLRSNLPPTVKMTRQLADDIGPVMANPGQISVMISNLVENAVDALNGETGELTVSLSAVSLPRPQKVGATELPAGRYARLDVKDTGRGMAPETIERVFDPFFTTKAVGEGTGLGLSMVYGIVERQNGAIEVSSEIGKGTQVSVYLPVTAAESRAISEAAVIQA